MWDNNALFLRTGKERESHLSTTTDTGVALLVRRQNLFTSLSVLGIEFTLSQKCEAAADYNAMFLRVGKETAEQTAEHAIHPPRLILWLLRLLRCCGKRDGTVHKPLSGRNRIRIVVKIRGGCDAIQPQRNSEH